MNTSTSVVHSLPVNIDADGTKLKLPKEFLEAGLCNNDFEGVHTAHLRGRELRGRAFQMPADSVALIIQHEESGRLEDVPSTVRMVGEPVQKFLIWDTDVESGLSVKLQSALIWSKLNGALCD